MESLPSSRPGADENDDHHDRDPHDDHPHGGDDASANNWRRSQHLSQGDSSSSKSSIVKEFRRSSEILRNILLSLSSRRSSASESGSSNTNPYLSASGIEAADLQAALQSHRERSWMHPDSPHPSPDSPVFSTGRKSAIADLFDAVSRGDLKRIRLLLRSGMDPNVSNNSGYTVLHWCTVQTPLPWLVIIELLEFGCRVEIPDRDGTQPVFLVPSLPRIQYHLVKDVFDFLQRSVVEMIPELAQQQCQASRDAASRQAGNIFRRFQQSTARKTAVAKPKSKDFDACENSNLFDIAPFKVSFHRNIQIILFIFI